MTKTDQKQNAPSLVKKFACLPIEVFKRLLMIQYVLFSNKVYPFSQCCDGSVKDLAMVTVKE
jgi:hypothetical protein